MNCRFLHHWIWISWDGGGRYWRAECKFCGLFSNRAATEPPPAGSPNPTEKAGVRPSTRAPAPFKGA
jgi:hypothetical protein